MRLSTKGRFAITAMIDVALREGSGPVPLSEIAARHQISLSYLEQMFSKLRQHGLVESTRGPGGNARQRDWSRVLAQREFNHGGDGETAFGTQSHVITPLEAT